MANHLINHSGPWDLLMQRHAPDLHAQMVEAKHQAVERQRLAPAIRDRLARLGLPGDADTLRKADRVVSEKLTLGAQQPLVDQFLRTQGGDPQALLGPRWSTV